MRRHGESTPSAHQNTTPRSVEKTATRITGSCAPIARYIASQKAEPMVKRRKYLRWSSIW